MVCTAVLHQRTAAAGACSSRGPARSRIVRTVAALPEHHPRPQAAFKAAGSGLLAAAVAAGMALTPVPALATGFAFGRPDILKEQQAEYNDALARMNKALEAAKRSAGNAAQETVKAVSSATPAAPNVKAADKDTAKQAKDAVPAAKQAADTTSAVVDKFVDQFQQQNP